MTTTWSIPPNLWAGETVAVLAPGPSMTERLAESLREHRTIVANQAVRFAPWADMYVAIDPWPVYWEADLVRDFQGMKICGVPHEDIDAFFPGIIYEKVVLGPGHVVECRNNGLLAIRIAAMAGASRILLAGFDGAAYAARDENVACGFDFLEAALDQLVAELRGRGIVVEEVGRTLPPPIPVFVVDEES